MILRWDLKSRKLQRSRVVLPTSCSRRNPISAKIRHWARTGSSPADVLGQRHSRGKGHGPGRLTLVALFHVRLEFGRDLIEPFLRTQPGGGKTLVARGTAPRHWAPVDFFRNN